MLISCSQHHDSVEGMVVDENGSPISYAVVSIKATDIETLTDQSGRFTLTGLNSDETVFITAWYSGTTSSTPLI